MLSQYYDQGRARGAREQVNKFVNFDSTFMRNGICEEDKNRRGRGVVGRSGALLSMMPSRTVLNWRRSAVQHLGMQSE